MPPTKPRATRSTLWAVPSGVTLAGLGIEGPGSRSARPTEETAHGFAFQPGLEGMRGLAVLAVLVFHGGFSWASGGFLGVSTFFTLSGFLITTLLLSERARRGSIGLKRFWARRFRRLMPASLVCLVGVLVFAATVATPAQLVNLRGDMLAALLYVANWRFIADGASYAELFVAPSPVLHFWSLAIEEQFYLLFPLVVAGLMAVARGSRRVLAVVLGLAAVGSVAYTAVLAASSIDAAYYSTFSRAAELLIGALLAMAVALPAVRSRLDHPRARTVVTAVGAVALLTCGWLWHTARQTDPWLYRGGLAAYAVLTAVLIVSVIETGPMRWVFSHGSLRWVGRISYGVYLYHWPIFLWLTPLRTGLSEWPLFALRLAVTFGAAVASYHLIEETDPLRATYHRQGAPCRRPCRRRVDALRHRARGHPAGRGGPHLVRDGNGRARGPGLRRRRSRGGDRPHDATTGSLDVGGAAGTGPARSARVPTRREPTGAPPR